MKIQELGDTIEELKRETRNLQKRYDLLYAGHARLVHGIKAILQAEEVSILPETLFSSLQGPMSDGDPYSGKPEDSMGYRGER